MAKARYKVGDLVRPKDPDDWIDGEFDVMNTVEKCRESIFRVVEVFEYTWGPNYNLEHEKDPDCFYEEVEQSYLTKVIVRPPTKKDMDYLYKSLGVKV